MNKDLEIARYFIPSTLKHILISDEDEKMYVRWSSQGKHKEKLKRSHFDDGFNALVYGKKYAGINLSCWEQGILEGSVSYWTLLGGEEGDEPIPRLIVDLMKGEMFKGADIKIIEDCYIKVLQSKTI